MPDLLISNVDGDTIAACPLSPRSALTVGRSEGNHLVVPIDSVSRRHVLVFDHENRWFAADLGSRHGLENTTGSVRFHEFTQDDAWVRLGPAYLWVAGVEPAAPKPRPSLFPDAPAGPVHLFREFHRPLETHPTASNDPQPGFLVFSSSNANAVPRLVDLGLVDRLIIGRDPSCDLIIDDPAVSRMHCILYREGHRFVVADAGSSKGLRADGSRWLRKRLEGGTLLQFGEVTARMLQPESPVAALEDAVAATEDPMDLGSIFEEPGTWAPVLPTSPRRS